MDRKDELQGMLEDLRLIEWAIVSLCTPDAAGDAAALLHEYRRKLLEIGGLGCEKLEERQSSSNGG